MKLVTYENVPGGNPELLGAMPLGANRGTNFAVYAGLHATGVEVCIFDREINPGRETRYRLAARKPVYQRDGSIIGNVWHGVAAEVGAGALYGIRVNGPSDQFNSQKLLIDPAAMAVTNALHWWTDKHRAWDRQDNADIMPKGIVTDRRTLHRANEGERGAIHSHADTRILEIHVRGSTILHPKIPENEQGKFKGLAHPDFVRWVKDMGFTSLELMPVAAFGTHPMFADIGMLNYWGYEPFAPMAPHPGYASSGLSSATEFAATIAALRAEKIETILDVVPNHTLEHSWEGQLVINLRGMDNSLYLGCDYTGTGNTRDFGHPMNVRYFLQQLKHWEALGVAGVRIDLAAVIGREHGRGFNPDSPMMRAIREDPDLHHFKFMGEPWDLGECINGRLSHAPPNSLPAHNKIAEWDGPYRDNMQQIAFGKADIQRSVIIRCIAGSEIEPSARVLKIGSHDGPTLSDMVTFTGKHNHANGENNRDGNSIKDGFYWGLPEDRMRVQRFAISLWSISQGILMMTHGHERRHTQGGNTNPHNQDNHITHIKWGGDMPLEGRELMEFTKSCLQFRAEHPSLRRARLFTGDPDKDSGLKFNGNNWMKDVTWLDPMAKEMNGEGSMDWPGGFAIMLSGDPGNSSPGEENPTRLVQRKERDSPLLILINPLNGQDLKFTLPFVEGMGLWTLRRNSLAPVPENSKYFGGQEIDVGWRSTMIFEGVRVGEPVRPRPAISVEDMIPVK